MSEEGGSNPPRVFVCYARDDRKVVYPEIDWLRRLGFDIHIDRHITPGVQWMEAVAEAISSSQLVLFYASENSVSSDYCSQELRFAMHRNIAVVTVKLTATDLPPWMELSLGDSQVLERFDMSKRSYRLLLEQGLSTHLDEKASPQPALSDAMPPHGNRWLWIFLGATGLLVVMVVFLRQPGTTASIAVQPFVAADPQSASLAQGITGDITDGLLKLDLLPVHVNSAQGSSDSTSTATYLVVGEIEALGDGFSIRTAMTNTRSRRRTWGQSWIYLTDDLQAVREAHVRRVLAILPDVLIGTISALDTATEANRARALARHNEAQALLAGADSQQALAGARQLFERALDEQPGYGAALLGLCRALRMEYGVVNEVELLIEAETRCLQALAVGTDPLSTHLALGDVFVTRGDRELAHTHYQRASTIAPDSASSWVGLGTVAEMSGDDDLALQYYEHAVALPTADWQAHNALGRFSISRGAFAKAAQQYQIVVELLPDGVSGHNNLGTARYYLGEFERASEAWRQVTEIEPEPLAWANLGAAYTYQRDFDAAIAAFQAAADMAPEDHRWPGHIAEILIYDNRSNVVEAQQILKRALALALEQLAHAGNDAVHLARMSTYHALLGEEHEARSRLDQATAEDPGDLQVLYSALQTQSLLGDRAQADRIRQLLLETGYPELLLERDPWVN